MIKVLEKMIKVLDLEMGTWYSKNRREENSFHKEVISIKLKIKEPFLSMVLYKMIQNGYSVEEIARCLGVAENTWHNRMLNPDMFRLYEMKELSRRLGIEFSISNGEIIAKDTQAYLGIGA